MPKPSTISVTPDQLSAAGSYIARNWSSYGYLIERIESPTWLVSVFHVAASDGSRFRIAADRFGNCEEISDENGSVVTVERMHANAATP